MLMPWSTARAASPNWSVGFVVDVRGRGPVVALGTDLVVGRPRREQAGSASAMSETSTELGMALGVATLGSVGTAVYRGLSRSPGTCPPRPPTPRETLWPGRPPRSRTSRRRSPTRCWPGREAFTSGLNVIGGMSTLLALGLAVAVVVGIRNRGADQEPDSTGTQEQAAAETQVAERSA